MSLPQLCTPTEAMLCSSSKVNVAHRNLARINVERATRIQRKHVQEKLVASRLLNKN